MAEPLSLDDQLIEATKKGDVNAVKDLLAKGANAAYSKFTPGVWGADRRESPIHHALPMEYGGNFQREIFKILLDAGADINAIFMQYDWRGCGSKVTSSY
jgi:hypothetical protein